MTRRGGSDRDGRGGDQGDIGRRLPRQHKAQPEGLALLVATMLDVRRVDPTDLAASLPRAAGRLDMRRQWIGRLSGDALIEPDAVMAPCAREIAARLASDGRAVGAPNGIAAGQAWECEPAADLAEYHRAKTGALFAGATLAGAAAAGADPAPWRELGERLGEAYQVADDIRDAAGDPDELGKPVGRDLELGRQSAVLALGLEGAVARLDGMVVAAVDSLPACPGRSELQGLIRAHASRCLPEGLARVAA